MCIVNQLVIKAVYQREYGTADFSEDNEANKDFIDLLVLKPESFLVLTCLCKLDLILLE